MCVIYHSDSVSVYNAVPLLTTQTDNESSLGRPQNFQTVYSWEDLETISIGPHLQKAVTSQSLVFLGKSLLLLFYIWKKQYFFG